LNVLLYRIEKSHGKTQSSVRQEPDVRNVIVEVRVQEQSGKRVVPDSRGIVWDPEVLGI
jgi:hypothetical protein